MAAVIQLKDQKARTFESRGCVCPHALATASARPEKKTKK
jgi:hypothetical protein